MHEVAKMMAISEGQQSYNHILCTIHTYGGNYLKFRTPLNNSHMIVRVLTAVSNKALDIFCVGWRNKCSNDEVCDR